MSLYILLGLAALILPEVVIWLLRKAKVKSEEATSKEDIDVKQYEPDCPVRELLELIIRDGYAKNAIDYGYMFNFYMNGAKYISRCHMYVSYENDYSYNSDIAWLTRSETEWLYEQLETHYRKQKEYEKKKQREEAGEWIKQELGATDKAKSVLQKLKQTSCFFQIDGSDLSNNELEWISKQLHKGTIPNSD